MGEITTVTVTLTPAMVRRSQRLVSEPNVSRSNNCLVALGIQEALPKASKVTVGGSYFLVNDEGPTYDLTPTLRRVVDTFDALGDAFRLSRTKRYKLRVSRELTLQEGEH